MIKIIDNYLFRLGKELEYTELKLHNLKNELVEQLHYIKNWGGKFIIAVPELEVF